MNEEPLKFRQGVLVFFAGVLLSGLIVGFWANSVYSGRLRNADTELDRYRASVDELQRTNGDLERANAELDGSARSLRATIVDAHGKAVAISDSIASLSGQSSNSLEQLRRTIDALKTIQGRIRGLESSLLD
jgi:chromosome segregation ATPase